MKTETQIDGGKYTIVHDNGINIHILRYGERWADDEDGFPPKVVLACAAEIDTLRADREKLLVHVGKDLAKSIMQDAEIADLKKEKGECLAQVRELTAQVLELRQILKGARNDH